MYNATIDHMFCIHSFVWMYTFDFYQNVVLVIRVLCYDNVHC